MPCTSRYPGEYAHPLRNSSNAFSTRFICSRFRAFHCLRLSPSCCRTHFGTILSFMAILPGRQPSRPLRRRFAPRVTRALIQAHLKTSLPNPNNLNTIGNENKYPSVLDKHLIGFELRHILKWVLSFTSVAPETSPPAFKSDRICFLSISVTCFILIYFAGIFVSSVISTLGGFA